MKFVASQSAFSAALNSAMGVVPGRSTLQVLTNFLLNLEGNMLEIGATDLDTSIRLRVEVEGIRDGSILVSAKELFDMIKIQKAPQVEFDVENYLVHVQAGQFKANVSGNDAEDFPDMEQFGENSSVSINSSELQFLSDKSLFAVSTDTSRMSLNGACMHAEGEKLVLIATDGHKLGRAVIDHQVAEGTEVILPAKVIGQILKSVPVDSDLDITLGERHVSFAADGLKLVSKLIEGPYPRYQNVVPLQFEKEALFDRNALLEVVERVGVMTHPRTKQISLAFGASSVKIDATNQERGNECEEFVDCEYNGEADFKIGLNSAYFSMILRKCGSDRIRIKMNGPLGATVIEAEGQEGEYYFLLMPLRLND